MNKNPYCCWGDRKKWLAYEAEQPFKDREVMCPMCDEYPIEAYNSPKWLKKRIRKLKKKNKALKLAKQVNEAMIGRLAATLRAKENQT